MFNKLKHLKELRSAAKNMQNALADEVITVEKGGITVIMNGNMEVTKIIINEDLAKDSLEGMLMECVNEAIRKTQRIMTQKMRELGGFPGLN